MNVYRTDNIDELLENNSYVGRGLIIGKSLNGEKAVVAYFIMGRSQNSQNRTFAMEEENLKILPFDETKVDDPSLIIYYPLKSINNKLIVTNGDQTDTIYDYLKEGKTFEEALETRSFEPDEPHFTPRISGIVTFNKNNISYKMSILKSGNSQGTSCDRYTFSYEGLNGIGQFLHTYMNDGNPIPTFLGEPERVNIPDEIDHFTNSIWKSLDNKNKISLYVRYTDINTKKYESRLINKNE